MTNKYSFFIGLEKTFFRVVAVGAPLLLEVLPEQWMNLTLGGALIFLVNYAKNRNKKEE